MKDNQGENRIEMPGESLSPNRKSIFKKIRFRRTKNDPSSQSPSSSPSSSPGGTRRKLSGRFGTKKKNSLDSSSGSTRSRGSESNSNPASITIPEDSVLQTRRVIKAARPIPTQPYPPTFTTPTTSAASSLSSDTMKPSSSDESIETNNTSPVNDKIQIRGLGNSVLPSVQDENLREKTEQWRKERLDATMAIRKENKEKEIMEHRRNNSICSEEEIVEKNVKKNEVVVPDEIEVSEIFKTRTFHPEHKRKVDEDDKSNNKQYDSEKKLKIDENAGEEGGEEIVEDDEADEKKVENRMNRMLKLSVEMPAWVAPATVVAAAACAFAIVMMKSIRSKR